MIPQPTYQNLITQEIGLLMFAGLPTRMAKRETILRVNTEIRCH